MDNLPRPEGGFNINQVDRVVRRRLAVFLLAKFAKLNNPYFYGYY